MEKANSSGIWKGRIILIAEDEEINFRYLEAVINRTGAEIHWAKDGLEVIRLFNELPKIDLVLMDIKMPNMNGYDATREIKKTKSSVPVIAQTAYAMAEEKQKCIEAGCDHYLSKPIRKDDLMKVMTKFLQVA